MSGRPGKNGGTLKTGNPGNSGGGRPKLSALKDREELLDAIWAPEEEFDPAEAHPFVSRMRELAMTSSSSATLEYLISQRIGSPRTRMEVVLSKDNFLKALADELKEQGLDKEKCLTIVRGVHARLNPDAG